MDIMRGRLYTEEQDKYRIILRIYTYSGDDLENLSYKASVIYTSTDGYKVKATAYYEKEGMSLKQKIIVFSAGILVLAVAAAIVIVLAKRKKKEA